MRNTTKAFVVAALAGGCILATTARAHAANPACNSYQNPVYFSGSTAAPPMLAQLAVQLGTSVSIIYTAVGSCVGMNDILGPNTGEPAAAVYLDPTNATNQIACDPTNGGQTPSGLYIDVGISDVYPATCATYSGTPMLGTGFKDFQGPIQAMTMAVQKTSTENSISAEGAYVVFGWAGQHSNTIAPWTDPTQMFIRKPTSGTESMIAAAIGLPPTKWLVQSPIDGGTGQFLGGNPQVVTALQGASSANAAIGILSTEYLDQNRATLKALAFQAKDYNGGDQSCGYLPDSDSTHFDKLNVRQGRYAIWGAVHFVTNVDGSGNPLANPKNTASTNVKTVIDFISDNNLSTAQEQTLINGALKAYTVPQCAMQVSRTEEAGAEASYQPTRGCGCAYEAGAQGGTPTSSYCKACTMDTDCASVTGYSHCNFGWCEAQ